MYAPNKLVSMTEPAWMEIAKGELGVHETPGSKATARIVEYAATTTLHATSDEVPWCSSFVNWVLKQGSIPGTNSARALSWLGWGTPCSGPALGSVAVISYGGGKGHVGFVAGKSGKNIVLLGGNQSDSVRYSVKSPLLISGYRLPRDYPQTLELPEMVVAPGGSLDLSGTR